MPIRFSSQDIQRRFCRLSIAGIFFPVVLGCSLFSAPAGPENPEATGRTVEPADTKALVYNAPGQYTFHDKCFMTIDMTIEGGGPSDPVPEFRSAELWVCVNGVLVNEDRTMRFDIEYTLTPTDPGAGPVTRDSDRNNENVFLTDDRGGRYEAADAGGCAVKEMRAEKESETCLGWFEFPPPDPEARSFVFHYATADTTEGSDEIAGIELTDPD